MKKNLLHLSVLILAGFLMLNLSSCKDDDDDDNNDLAYDYEEIARQIVQNNDDHNFEANLDLVDTAFVGYNHFMPDGIHGNQGLVDFFYLTEGISFPDGKHTVYNVIVDGDIVALEFSFKGTFTAALPNGLQPNNKEVDFRYTCICKCAEGKIYEITWYNYDSYALMVQLGMFDESISQGYYVPENEQWRIANNPQW